MGKRSATQHYLRRYAESEINLLSAIPWPQSYRHILCIPAYAETPAFLQRLQTLCAHHKALVVVVINQPDEMSDCPANHELVQFITDRAQLLHSVEHLSLFDFGGAHLLSVKRYQKSLALPKKFGVGLARKIAADIGVQLISRGIISSRWLHTTDADVTLPRDYFSCTESLSGAAAVYPFHHHGDLNPITAATLCYQQSLQHYVDGLRWAGSPYAFHTVGSCLAINSDCYCQARGFPKRAGGEDFYLLNKLAKLGPIMALAGTPLLIAARRSQRAPFGTGPAVEKILALSNLDQFHTYDPEVFVELKEMLRLLSKAWEFLGNESGWYQALSPAARQASESLGLDQLFLHLRKQARNRETAQRHIQHWFDGFRTLKFIHLLQGNYYPPMPLRDALTKAEMLYMSNEEVLL